MATPPAPPPPAPAPAPVEVQTQLTQVRVPLSDAADAFTVADAYGRFPIVVLTGERSRIRNEFVVAGVGLVLAALLLGVNIALRGGLVAAGVALIVLGLFRSFIVRVPEGAQALALRAGRFDRALPAGNHLMWPWIMVSHVVTRREIPFMAAGSRIPTADGVGVDVSLLVTFAIQDADRFVFSISAPDFDLVCTAASQEALRRHIRGVPSAEVLDLAGAASDALRGAIAVDLETYGVVVHKVVVVTVRLPAEYMASLESRRLAEVQQAEQAERHTLERRVQADRYDLQRQKAQEHRKLIDIEAANEAARLEQLEARIGAFPQAAAWDVESQRMEIARTLAGNDHAIVSVGDPAKLADALIVAAGQNDLPEAGADRPRRSRSAPRAAQKAKGDSTPT